jgi:hypothetical protein
MHTSDLFRRMHHTIDVFVTQRGPDKFGRVPPCVIAGQGAFDWVTKRAPHLISKESRILKTAASTEAIAPDEKTSVANSLSHTKSPIQTKSSADQYARLGSVNATARARETWKQWDETIRKFERLEESKRGIKRVNPDVSDDDEEDLNVSAKRLRRSPSSLDTVGAVCVDQRGQVAAAASSGGELLCAVRNDSVCSLCESRWRQFSSRLI